MASSVKISNANGKIVTIENNDSNMSDVTLNGASITKKVDTLADMRVINELPETVWCSGYHSKNDGAFGSHFYRLKGLKTTETDNSGTVIIVSVGGSDYVYELQFDGAVNVKWFGAKGDGVTDDYLAIQNAINFGPSIIVDGTYASSEMITLNEADSLTIGKNTKIVRLSSHSSLEPVIWIKQSSASVIGTDYNTSIIETEKVCPDGIIKIGAESMSENSTSSNLCIISNIRVKGSTLFGRTSGSPDVAIHIPSPQLNGNTNYFHNIANINLESVNIGLWLRGWANGLIINNIFGNAIGNTLHSSTQPYYNCMILNDGALDNNISNVFFHYSANTTGVIVKSLDNTSNGSPSVMDPQANSFKGIITEQGGNSYSIEVVSSSNSYFEVVTNTVLGWKLHSSFKADRNIFKSGGYEINWRTDTNNIIADTDVLIGKLSSSVSSKGCQFRATAASSITTDNTEQLILNRLTTSGATNVGVIRVMTNTVDVGGLYAGSGDRIGIASGNIGIGVDVSLSSVLPFTNAASVSDNTVSLGWSTARWSTIYAGTGTINTSDDREKTYISIEDKEILVAEELKKLVKKFKFNDAIEEKGIDKARIHFGTSAQEVKATFEKHGLIAEDYAILCHDEWEAEYEQVIDVEAELDEECNVIKEATYKNGDLIREAGDRYGIRYEELLCFIIGAM